MAKDAQAVPAGYHTITPVLTIRGADKAIAFYKEAFGAEEQHCMLGPDGRVMHAVIKIGDSAIMLSDEFPEHGGQSPESLGGAPGGLHLYVEDVDALFGRALGAGAVVKMPLMDAFWGDRYGKLTDPFGHNWSLATRKEDLTGEEIDRRARALFAGTPDCGQAKAS